MSKPLTKAELIAKATELGLPLNGNETVAQLKVLIAGEVIPTDPTVADDTVNTMNAPSVSRPKTWEDLQSPGVFVKIVNRSKGLPQVQALLTQPKVSIVLTLNETESLGSAFWEGTLNGVSFNILKGITVQLPQQVAEHVNQNFVDSSRAAREVLVRNPYTGKLTNMNLEERPESDRSFLGL